VHAKMTLGCFVYNRLEFQFLMASGVHLSTNAIILPFDKNELVGCTQRKNRYSGGKKPVTPMLCPK
jgi:hypothetical protein